MIKDRTNRLFSRGFIELPAILISLIGFLFVSTGTYYVVNKFNDEDVLPAVQEKELEETYASTSEENLTLNSTAEDKKIEKILEKTKIIKKPLDINQYKLNKTEYNDWISKLQVMQDEVDVFQKSLLETKTMVINSKIELSEMRIKKP